MKIAIDLDNSITATKESIEFFSILSNLLIAEHRIVILTNRGTEQEIACYLVYLGIDYSEIVITGQKEKYISENRISIYFGNCDSFEELGKEVVVFQIR